MSELCDFGEEADASCYHMSACGCKVVITPCRPHPEPSEKEIRSQWRWFIFFSLLMLTGVSINVYYFLCNTF